MLSVSEVSLLDLLDSSALGLRMTLPIIYLSLTIYNL